MCSIQYAGNYRMQFCTVILDKPGLLFNMNYLFFKTFFTFSREGASAPPAHAVGAHGHRISSRRAINVINDSYNAVKLDS